MKKILLSSLFLLLLFIPNYIQADPPTVNIPPTNAYAHTKLPNGTTINAKNFDATLDLSSLASGTSTSNIPTLQVIDIYDTTIGDYSTPSNATASSSCCHTLVTSSVVNGSTTTQTTGWLTLLTLQKNTAIPVGATITKVGVNVTAALGNIRVKVYDVNATNYPGALLGESGSNAVAGTGVQNYTVSAIVGSSGKVWVGFEVDNNGFGVRYQSMGTAVQCHVLHTYGTGPDPFGTCIRSTNLNFRYWVTYTASTGPISHPVTNVFDSNTATYWESNNEVHPYVYVDTGSAQILSASSMFWNSSSTCTQLSIQTSSDTLTWNTKRTTNTNLLTNNVWNYIRWDLDPTTERYVKFYCNDAGSKQLSFYELKTLIPSSTALLLRHGHEYINSTNATLPLSQ